MSMAELPEVLHVLFEDGELLGIFTARDKAMRMCDAYIAGGNPEPAYRTYCLQGDHLVQPDFSMLTVLQYALSQYQELYGVGILKQSVEAARQRSEERNRQPGDGGGGGFSE